MKKTMQGSYQRSAGFVLGLGMLLGFSGTLVSPTVTQAADPAFADLERLATQSLTADIAPLPSGNFLKAGGHQFQGLWSRDFAFGTRGLMHLGRVDVFRDHLSLVLDHLRVSDGLVPRYLDSSNTTDRYIGGFLGKDIPLTEPLIANYSGGGNEGQAVDANALILIVALDYLHWTGDVTWWNNHQAQLVKAYRFYDAYLHEGLVVQPTFADWQDSVNRQGKTFFCNLLFYVATQRLQGYPGFNITSAQVADLRAKLIQTFLDPTTGLYFSVAGQPQISLEGNLLAIDLGLHPAGSFEASVFYGKLRQHPLWTFDTGTFGVFPGYATYPDYPASQIQWSVKLSGLSHYHDSIYWSWLIGLAAKVAYEVGDHVTGDGILTQMQSMAIRDGGVAEIYRHEPPHERWTSLRYHSEMPFTWGSSLILDALGQRAVSP